MMYFLLNGETGNQMGSYESLQSALDDVRQAVVQHGRQVTGAWMLMRENSDGELDFVADRAELAALADQMMEQVSA